MLLSLPGHPEAAQVPPPRLQQQGEQATNALLPESAANQLAEWDPEPVFQVIFLSELSNRKAEEGLGCLHFSQVLVN